LREARGARERFARKLEPDWGTEIESGQAVDEQRIVSVGGLSNNWPQNLTQSLNKDVRFHVSARHALGDRFNGVRGRPFVYENIAKKNLKSARGASAASDQITERAQRQVPEHLLANGFRREIQHLANV
jgi:hypothetical protein